MDSNQMGTAHRQRVANRGSECMANKSNRIVFNEIGERHD